MLCPGALDVGGEVAPACSRPAIVRVRTSIFASREPRAYLTEFGAETQPVGFESEDMYNRPQTTLRGGRTTLPWSGNSPKVIASNVGYVIQPTIRERLPKFLDDLADSIATYYDQLVQRGR